MREIERKIVSAVLLSGDGKILLGRRDPKKGGVYADCWQIPGGGMDEGETREQALAREIREELGIDITGSRMTLHADTRRGRTEKTLKDSGERVICSMLFIEYVVEIPMLSSDIAMSLDDDLALARWFERSELANLQLTSPTVELLRELGWRIE